MQIAPVLRKLITHLGWLLPALLLSLPTASGALSATDVNYDGTRAGFAALVERTGLDWPVPTLLDEFEAHDGARLRYAHWAAADPEQRAGVVVFFSGRTEYIEKNIYTYRDLQARHYDVWTLDWRGQGLSARSIPQYPDRGHIDTFDTFVADAEQFIDDIVDLPRIDGVPKILLAHSMGGAIATLYLQSHPQRFDRAVFSAPMHGLRVDNTPVRWFFSMISPTRCVTIFGDCPWESNFKWAMDPCDFDRPARVAMFRNLRRAHIYSHDLNKLREQFCIVEAERRAGPPHANLGLGKPTAGWMTQAFSAITRMLEQATQLTTPLLIIGGGDDRVVSNDSQQALCDAAGEFCCRLEKAGASHELLIETEPMRLDFMNDFYDFTSSPLSAAAWCDNNS